MIIGVTDNMGSEHKWQLYLDWLVSGSPNIEVRKFSYDLDNASEVSHCDGVLFTGGGDVDPVLYGSNNFSKTLSGVNRKRDDFERNVIERALNDRIPLLGICRGMQIVNVHLGGSLIIDLEEAGYRSHRPADSADLFHQIDIARGSRLEGIIGNESSRVNSSHHQAVASPARGLRAVAVSPDGVIEGLEFEDSHRRDFFLLIQWHPERMKSGEDAASGKVLMSFLSSIQSSENKKRKVR